MNPSPLLLDNYYFKEITVKYHSGVDGDNKVIADDLKVDAREIRDQDNLRKWIFILTIELPEAATPKLSCTFRIELIGFFEVSESYDPALSERLARANGPAILYSAAREMLVILTGRGFGHTVILPSVNFLPPTHKQATSDEGKQITPEPSPTKAKPIRRAKRATKKSAQ
jgi:preprotein translocase subunit SecB